MKKITTLLLCSFLVSLATAQMVARADIKEPVEGICDIKNVYVLMPMLGEGQEEAVCDASDKDIETMLNKEVALIKDKPDYEDKGMVSIIINCKDAAVKFETDNKTKSPELDEEILNVFKKFTTWKSGKLNKKKVDCLKLWSFEIKDGKIKLN